MGVKPQSLFPDPVSNVKKALSGVKTQSLIPKTDSINKNDLLGVNTQFSCVLSGVEGLQGETGRVGLDVDNPVLLCNRNL
jgi:hypothetical protein